MAASLQPSLTQSSALKNVVLALGLVALTFLIYLPALHGGYIFDDELMFNPYVKARTGLYYIWFKPVLPDYFPLTYGSFWLEWQLWGNNLLGSHVINVALHAISAVLLWRVLAQLRISGAWLAALVFAIHPVNVESVAWISQRKNALAMPLFLAAILFHLKNAKSNYLASFVCFLCALLAKTAVVPLPFVLLLCDWWRNDGTIRREQILRLLPFFGSALALGLVTVWFQSHHAIGQEVVQTTSFAARLVTAGCAVWFYLYKALLPVQLMFNYPRWEISPRSFLSWIPLAALIAMFIVLFRSRKAWARHALFAVGSFILMLLPVLGFVDIYYHKFSLVADHWEYFAVAGPVALVTAAFVSIVRKDGLKFAIALPFVVVLCVLARDQAALFRNTQFIWRDTLEKNPKSWVAENNYGLFLLDAAIAGVGDKKQLFEESIAHFKSSLQLRSDNVEARINIGSALIGLGRVEEGKAEFNTAQKTNPENGMGFYNLGLIFEQQAKLADAETQYKEAIRVWPRYAAAWLGLGRVLERQTKPADAETAFAKAVEIVPVDTEARRSLARILELQGKSKEATAQYERLLRDDNGDAAAHYHLGNLLLKLHQDNEAMTHYAMALLIHDNYAEAHYQLAVLLEARGLKKEAVTHYRAAATLKPAWAQAANNAAWLLATSKDAGDGNDALRFAERAVMLTKTNDPDVLDTLSAALAEVGRFDDAVKTADEALQLATTKGMKQSATNIQQHRQLYLAKKAVRE